MKVAFYVYPVAFQSPGGGEVLLLKTKEYLEKAGQEVTLFNPWQDKLKDFDILHTFGSVKDCLRMMEAARTFNVKNVLSTICWYSWQSAWGTQGSTKDRAQAVLRHAAKCFLPMLPSERKRMMQVADVLIPNSISEADQLKKFFQVPDQKVRIILNAVDESFSESQPELFIRQFGFRDFVLCVGRIEPRKNQLQMVRALNGIDRPVLFLGDYVYAYRDYFEQCKKEAASNIHFLGGLPRESDLLASAYAACDTFVLASWLETPGLAALEAGLAGAKIVITDQGATQEYFKELAYYVSPANPQSIRQCVLKALAQPKSLNLKNHIMQHYTWQRVADETLSLYREVLNLKKTVQQPC